VKICASCGETGIADALYCVSCGRRFGSGRSTIPGAGGSRIGDFTIVASHGEGDLWVTDGASRARMLVFGPKEAMSEEANALAEPSPYFPTVLSDGHSLALGYFVTLTFDVEGALPLVAATLTFERAIECVRALLDAAAVMEARGFRWEPASSDLYLRPDGTLVAVRARGARRRAPDEPFNAKRVLEALGEPFLPVPLGLGSPALVRLLMPRANFSTVATRSIAATREEVDREVAQIGDVHTRSVAELCDPGLRRHHNEDATAIDEGVAHGEPFAVMVVCDGVSSSTHADRASGIASRVARDAIARFARQGELATSPAAVAVREAICAAHRAICDEKIEFGDGAPPGTTIVAALVFRRSLTVGWVGDSRAYWVTDTQAELCTTDHSWLNEAVEHGQVSLAEAMKSPLAHALTRCLGPLEADGLTIDEADPDVRTRAFEGPGHLVLCTDGLWNYFPAATSIAQIVRRAGPRADPAAIARHLVCSALAEGGGDNVTVAVHRVT